MKLKELQFDVSCYATDVNSEAVMATKETLEAHNVDGCKMINLYIYV